MGRIKKLSQKGGKYTDSVIELKRVARLSIKVRHELHRSLKRSKQKKVSSINSSSVVEKVNGVSLSVGT